MLIRFSPVALGTAFLGEIRSASRMQQHKQLALDVMKELFLPKLELYCACPITHCYLFNPQYKKGYIYSFFIEIFQSAIFKLIDSQQAYTEERLSNTLSRHIKSLNGRGPEKITTAVLDNRL